MYRHVPKPISNDTWFYAAKESGSIGIANRLIDTITNRFLLLAGFLYIGRSRNEDFGRGCRSLTVGEYVIVYCVEDGDVLILRVLHGRRDLDVLFRHSQNFARVPFALGA